MARQKAPNGARDKVPPFREYELFVRDVMQQLVASSGATTVNVDHDVHVLCRDGQAHQVDVYWEHRLGTVLHRVAVDCKHYNKNVSKLHVQAMIGLLDDVPGLSGMIVTKKGFQRGAERLAAKHGIALRIVRPAEDRDYEGLIRCIEARMQLFSNHVHAASFQIDKAWYDAQPHTPELDAAMSAAKGSYSTDSVRIEDRKTGTSRLLTELTPTLPGEGPETGKTHTLHWEDAYGSFSGTLPLKLLTATFQYDVRVYEDTIKVESKLARAVVLGKADDVRLFVEQDGQITGPSAD